MSSQEKTVSLYRDSFAKRSRKSIDRSLVLFPSVRATIVDRTVFSPRFLIGRPFVSVYAERVLNSSLIRKYVGVFYDDYRFDNFAVESFPSALAAPCSALAFKKDPNDL